MNETVENAFIKALELYVRNTTNFKNITYKELEELIGIYIKTRKNSSKDIATMKKINDDVLDIKETIELVKKARNHSDWNVKNSIINSLEKILVKYDKETVISLIMFSLFFT